ncbi:GAF domain-containing protein [Streptomyces sp. NPDC005805]|uniref:GAF domain-containing sensor histidine kinase n=1 Tax=Streptomyces sp. NPDC005805 TaxID=3157068 RepID=UPI0033C13E96
MTGSPQPSPSLSSSSSSASPSPAPPSAGSPGERDEVAGLPTGPAARVPRLLEAMRSIGAGPDLRSTLDRVCRAAAELTDARYAALGVVDPDGRGLSDFVTHGVGAEVGEAIGRRPDGHRGLLGALIHDPAPLRLADLADGPRAAGFPPGHPPMRTFLGVPVRVHGEVFGNLYLTEKTGGREFTEDDLHMVRVLATEAGIAVRNARLREAARQREHWIDGAVAVTTALLSGGDADEALTVVAEQARRLADAAAGVVLLPADGGGLEVVAVSWERPPGTAGAPGAVPELLGVVIPARAAAVERLLAGEAVFVTDSATDPRLAGTGLAGTFGPGMLLPLSSGGRVLGALALPRRHGGRGFTAAERTFATRFAAQAALALMTAETQRDRQRLAVLQDRDRIARDLHDLVIQRLFTAGMLLERARRTTGSAVVREGVEQAVGELDTTIREIRSAVFALQPDPGDAPSGLCDRVLREIGTAAVPLGFRPEHRFVGPVDEEVGEPAGKNLIAALREALSNAFRHAAAGRIEVVVDATAELPDGTGGVRLSVADDGVGVPDGGRRSGLRNLARRAESLGGSSRVGPGIGPGGAGTTVVWEAPR